MRQITISLDLTEFDLLSRLLLGDSMEQLCASDRESLRSLRSRIDLYKVIGPVKADSPSNVNIGGLAHDINNLLTTILGYVTMLSDDDHSTDPGEIAQRREQAAAVMELAKSASGLLKEVMSLEKKEAPKQTKIDIDSLVEDTCKILAGTLLQRGLSLKADCSTRGALVMGSKVEIEQAITNLVINAGDASESGGWIMVSTRSVSLGADAHNIHPCLMAGDYHVLSVCDTGCGIEESVKEKIFDPFFTTKGEKGTGLGLTMVSDIVRRHCGVITVFSTEGRGSTFDIYFKAVTREGGKHKDRLQLHSSKTVEGQLFNEENP